MERINQITITNYRAFYNEPDEENRYRINLPNGENLLIYGENGSGKSSLFKALQDFFRSAKEEFEPQTNVFTEEQSDLLETSINVRYTNDDEFEFNRLSSTAFKHDFFNNVKSSFLTYRDILNTYFFNINDQKNNPDLYDLFITEILYCLAGTHEISQIMQDIEKLKNHLSTFNKAYEDAIKKITDKDQKEEIFQNLKANINANKNELNVKLINHLKELLKVANQYLIKYFNFSVTLKNRSSLISIKWSKKNSPLIQQSLYLKLKLYGFGINLYPYQAFLNEARLSALALSIYLAALKIESIRLPIQNHKFLFLDDIFIGLDASNRIPLLEILKKDFGNFQIFITTYDRHWFEVAKNWFERKSATPWKSFELYTDDYTYTDKEVPKLLPYKDALAQAINYYKKSDYSASGNYLRKACEEVLKKILPNICLKDSDGIDLKKLSQKIERALYFFKMVNKATDDLDSLYVYLQELMNPLSHYDLDVSVFRKELKEVEQALNNLIKADLTKYSFKLLLRKGNMVKLSYQVDAVTWNVYELKVREDLWIYKENDNAQIQLSACQCRNENLYEMKNETKGKECHKQLISISLKQFYINMVNHENQQRNLNIPILSNYESLYEYEKVDKTWDRLQNIIKF